MVVNAAEEMTTYRERDEDMLPAEQGVKAHWKEDYEAGTGICLFHEGKIKQQLSSISIGCCLKLIDLLAS
jgi:hypothetical protein